MRWICTFLLFFLLTFQQAWLHAQASTAVVHATFKSGAPGNLVELAIEHVVNGPIQDNAMITAIPANHSNVLSLLRRFPGQKWLLTLELSENIPKIISAYGLGVDQPNVSDFLPSSRHILPSHPVREYPHSRTLSLGSQEQEIVEKTNEQRMIYGNLPPLKQVTNLHKAADCHSERMAVADFFAHCDLYTNKSPGTRINEAGYQWNSYGENIAAGNSTSTATMNQWMGSSGHRNNILSTNYREIGVGFDIGTDPGADYFDNGQCNPGSYGGPYTYYWTQNFGRRNSVYPIVIDRELASTTDVTVNLFIYGPGNATSMRLKNENNNWSSWMSYTPSRTWTLSSGNGTKTVHVQVSTAANGGGTIYSSSDQIELNGNCNTMAFQNQTLHGSTTYTDCEIIADPNVTISGQIIFEASSVLLGTEVIVPAGATFEVRIQ